jgi:hypothetical protein
MFLIHNLKSEVLMYILATSEVADKNVNFVCAYEYFKF